jgi:hypothetical protein
MSIKCHNGTFEHYDCFSLFPFNDANFLILNDEIKVNKKVVNKFKKSLILGNS